MVMTLILKLDGFHFYGHIPDTGYAEDPRVERYWFAEETRDRICNEIYEINKKAGTLLDYADVDFFNASQCVRLKEWLEKRLSKACDNDLRKFYEKLYEYTDRAILLGTGIVLEL